MLGDWGLSELAHKEYERTASNEMKHADKADQAHPVSRAAWPIMQDLGKLMILWRESCAK